MQDMCRGSPGLNKSEVGCVELHDGSKFELADKFCYFGDMLCAGGGAMAGAEAGAEARVETGAEAGAEAGTVAGATAGTATKLLLRCC